MTRRHTTEGDTVSRRHVCWRKVALAGRRSRTAVGRGVPRTVPGHGFHRRGRALVRQHRLRLPPPYLERRHSQPLLRARLSLLWLLPLPACCALRGCARPVRAGDWIHKRQVPEQTCGNLLNAGVLTCTRAR